LLKPFEAKERKNGVDKQGSSDAGLTTGCQANFGQMENVKQNERRQKRGAHAIIPGNTHRPEYPNWSTRRAAGQGCSRQGCVGGHEIIRNKKKEQGRDHTNPAHPRGSPFGARVFWATHTNLLRGLAAWHSSQNPAKSPKARKFSHRSPLCNRFFPSSHTPPQIILPSNDRAPQATPLP
jgi:hypothetical protein